MSFPVRIPTGRWTGAMRTASCGLPSSGGARRLLAGRGEFGQEALEEGGVRYLSAALDVCAPDRQVGGVEPGFGRGRDRVEDVFKPVHGLALEQTADHHQLVVLEVLELDGVGELVPRVVAHLR